MALVTKMTRCAVCGSSDVSFDGKTYHCATCGTDSDVSMPAADIAAVNRIVAMGNDAEEELPRLRRQYRNLDISSWDKENRLQTKSTAFFPTFLFHVGDTTKEEHRVCGTVFFFYAADGPCGAVKEPAHRARSAKQAAVIAAACFPIRNILSSAGRSP